MVMTEFKLLAETKNTVWSYSVTIDESVHGLVRLVVSRAHETSSKEDVFQGVDLTAKECEALGKHLIAVADRLSNSGP